MMNYAIVGGGRLARHFSHYFHLLDIPHTCWVRDHESPFNSFDLPAADERLRKTLAGADRVLLLVTDSAIAGLLRQYPFLHDQQLIHCSGASSFPGVAGAHPLMTFTDQLYEPDTYRKLPFVIEAGHGFCELFPDLPNPHYVIDIEDKARYHAMCVLAGNFAQLMWKGVADRFERQFDWPAETLQPYLGQVAANFIQSPGSALTGPLTRGDRPTIERNINALDGDALQGLYRAFIHFYQSEQRRDPVMGQAHMEKTA